MYVIWPVRPECLKKSKVFPFYGVVYVQMDLVEWLKGAVILFVNICEEEFSLGFLRYGRDWFLGNEE